MNKIIRDIAFAEVRKEGLPALFPHVTTKEQCFLSVIFLSLSPWCVRALEYKHWQKKKEKRSILLQMEDFFSTKYSGLYTWEKLLPWLLKALKKAVTGQETVLFCKYRNFSSNLREVKI